DPKINPLNGVSVDLKKFGEILDDEQYSTFDVEILTNSKLLTVRKAITDISRKANESDIIFFYYSGHGLLDVDKSLYLTCYDSEQKYLDATCLDAGFVLSQFKKSKCKSFIIIIDACHSGAMFNNVLGLPKGLFALTACDEDEVTMENEDGGVFTHIITTGLKSDFIDANRDGKITFSELFDYIIEENKKNKKYPGEPQKWEWNVSKDIAIFDSPKMVFMSYKRVQLDLVKKMSATLREADIPTYMDLEKIRTGDNWRAELERTIINARVFLFIMDKEILFSEVSNWELETAFANNIPILPIQVEEVQTPAMFNAKYGHINRLQFDVEHYEENMEILIDHIKSLRISRPNEVTQMVEGTR
ncbi:MAG: TIR domain-containing protein, partial [Bacteroidota bacterium]